MCAEGKLKRGPLPCELKTPRGKEIALVKVVWLGAAGESMTWELESQMRESYLELFV